MKLEKLPSGSYRVRTMVNGKRYSLTFDHRPTQKELAEELNFRRTGSYNGKLTFGFAAEEYIKDRNNTLSPASVKEYNNRLKGISDKLKEQLVDTIKSNDVQREINLFASSHSPKTTKNQYLFIQAVLGAYREDLRLKVKLPALEKKEPYIPKSEDVKLLLDHIKDTQLELCVRLGALSLRRGEMCALSLSDLNGNYLTINKDKVQNVDNEWIIKPTPKTSASNRTIYVPDRVVELAHTVGFFNGNPSSIYVMLTRAQDEVGLPHFSIHKMRHYFASVALQSMSEADVMHYGGWNSDGTMKRIYRHTLEDNSKEVAASIADSLN